MKRILLSALLLFTSTHLLLAFGKEGHAIVGSVAMQYLSESAKAKLKHYLGDQSLADIASWMDEIKKEQPETGPMHYINIEKDETYVANNSVHIINELNRVFKDLDNYRTNAEDKVLTDIKYLVHLVGDLHQPLHAGYGTDEGGNKIKVRYKGKQVKLHGFWDYTIIEDAGITTAVCLEEAAKLSDKKRKEIMKPGVIAWMNESRAYLPQVYAYGKNAEISEAYLIKARTVLVKQLMRAGLRLAAVLNDSFTSNSDNISGDPVVNISGKNYKNITATLNLEVLEYPNYTVGYSNMYKIPVWTYYELTGEESLNCVVDRKGDFEADKGHPVLQATAADYKTKVQGKVYDKGHMVPCESLTYDCNAMASTFYYTNCAPQTTNLNRGPWRTLEGAINNWAVDNEKVLIFTGNFVSDKSKRIGPNKIAVPDSCFKIVVDITGPDIKGIAFVMPNQNTPLDKPASYVRSIDQVEEYLGFDFFSAFPESLQKQFEAKSLADDWDFSVKRYEEERKSNCKKYNTAHPDEKCKCKEE